MKIFEVYTSWGIVEVKAKKVGWWGWTGDPLEEAEPSKLLFWDEDDNVVAEFLSVHVKAWVKRIA